MYLCTMADYMTKAHRVDLMPDGMVVFPDGDRFPIEDYGDCLISPVPVDNPFDVWAKTTEGSPDPSV